MNESWLSLTATLVPLAILMGAVTYPWRAVPMLVPGIHRLPEQVQLYLRLVGPAALAALAAVNTMVLLDPNRHPTFHIGADWIAVGLCIALVAMKRSLLVGLVLAAALIAALRVTGLSA